MNLLDRSFTSVTERGCDPDSALEGFVTSGSCKGEMLMLIRTNLGQWVLKVLLNREDRSSLRGLWDVFSQRTSSAWQGMQPQRLTVSLLLPCMGSKADEWLDFMQRQRQFWPTMTTRHASLAPIEMLTFQRERGLMQSKHLWDTFSIDWYKLDSKLYCSKPTGHSRELLWTHLFV